MEQRRVETLQSHLCAAKSTDGWMLSREQIEQYKSEGYVVVRHLFGEGELDFLHNRFVEIAKEGERNGFGRTPNLQLVRDINVADGTTKREAENAIIKLNHIQDDETFMKYGRDKRILACVTQLSGSPNLCTINSMYVCKPPGLSHTTIHPSHQDTLYFPIEVDQVVAAWTAVGDCTIENGCLSVVPNSHHQGVVSHTAKPFGDVPTKFNVGYVGVSKQPQRDELVHLEMKSGDTVFFHPNCIHGSGRNQSNGFRKAISFHYAAVESPWARFMQREEKVSGSTYVSVLAEELRIRNKQPMETSEEELTAIETTLEESFCLRLRLVSGSVKDTHDRFRKHIKSVHLS